MLIRYRCGVVRSARNKTCRNRTDAVIGRSTIHMRSSFTIKRSVPTWRPTIRVHRSEQVASVSAVNNLITSTYSNSISWDSLFGMIYLLIMESFCLRAKPKKNMSSCQTFVLVVSK